MSGLNGCSSYKELEDSIRKNSVNRAGKEENIPEDGETDTQYENKSNINAEVKFGIGDTMEYKDGYAASITKSDGVFQYTLQEVKIITQTSEIPETVAEDIENANQSMRTIQMDNQSMILIRVRIKNVSADPKKISGDQETKEYPFYIESRAGSESNILDPQGPFMEEAVYFSGHPDKLQKYFAYHLDMGEEREAEIAWIVPNKVLEEPYYWVIGSGQSAEYQKYFLLNGEEAE